MTQPDSPTPSTHPSPAEPAAMPIEEIARYPLPGTAAPANFAFSPDDRVLSYLFSPENTLVRQLYAFDPASGVASRLVDAPGGTREESISREEALRRERQRRRELGVMQYTWSPQGDWLLIPLQGDLYTLTYPAGKLAKILDCQGKPVQDPQLSPDGKWVAYVQESELYVLPSAGGELRQLTSGADRPGLTHGLAEYAAQEEMGRSHGFWWSPDSRRIAFEEVDETQIPVYRILHQGKAELRESAQEDHHYPFAGQANVRVRLGVVALEGGEPAWMDLGPDPELYLARVDWFLDGSLTAQVENRPQTRLDLLRIDLTGGDRTVLLTETSQVWINLHNLLRPLRQGGFVWASERSGFRHLYLYDGQGCLVQPLTQGEWLVEDVAGVDEKAGHVYFTATKESPLELHLYAVPLHGAPGQPLSEPRRITSEPGVHAVTMDHGCRRFVDLSQALDRPPQVTLRSLEDGSALAELFAERDPRIERLGLQPPEIVSLQNREGMLLYGALYRPPARFGPGPYPTIIWVYGGPHAQQVVNSWAPTVQMRLQYLRSLGFLVFILDNRGSARRGLAFEGALRHHMGTVEVQDQVDGVHWLVAQGLADPARVAIMGWSYGGYMAAMCLARAPETFQVAVAGAPVVAWDGYDTHYTERYMGTPQSNPDGYADSSVLSHVDNLRGKLLLIHGLIDENVHFRHTARLINALIHYRKPYELLLFPDERHMPRSLDDRIYMEEQIRDFLLRNL
ncbi:MAG TPA: S9 family peptidase [Anaerolineales bacterium]